MTATSVCDSLQAESDSYYKQMSDSLRYSRKFLVPWDDKRESFYNCVQALVDPLLKANG